MELLKNWSGYSFGSDARFRVVKVTSDYLECNGFQLVKFAILALGVCFLIDLLLWCMPSYRSKYPSAGYEEVFLPLISEFVNDFCTSAHLSLKVKGSHFVHGWNLLQETHSLYHLFLKRLSGWGQFHIIINNNFFKIWIANRIPLFYDVSDWWKQFLKEFHYQFRNRNWAWIVDSLSDSSHRAGFQTISLMVCKTPWLSSTNNISGFTCVTQTYI